MSSPLHFLQLLKPAAPDPVIQGLLAFKQAEQLPLAAGEAHSAPLEGGAYELIAAARGSLLLSYPDGAMPVGEGQAALLCAVGEYTVEAAGDCLCMTARLCGEMADRLLAPEEACTLLRRGAAPVREAVLSLSVLERESGGIDSLTASSYAYALLMKLYREAAAPEPDGHSALVSAALGIIEEDFAFLEGLDALAEQLEVSKAHLIRTFTREVGVSPGKYITRVRVEYAKLLLCEEGVSISFAAEASGFANANYFAKVFRREIGMTPSEYLQTAPAPAQGRLRGRVQRDML